VEGGLCFLHGNPDKARELGRIGGRSKVRAMREAADPLPPLDNAVGVRDAMAQVIADAAVGKRSSEDAECLVSMLTQQLHAIEVAVLEEEVKGLERNRAGRRLERGPNGNGGGAGPDFDPAPAGAGANGNANLQPANQGREEIRGGRSLPTKGIKAC